MRIAWLLICFYGLSFSTAHAATLINLGSSSCSGGQSFDASNGLSFSCSGDFSLSTGGLSSDTGIIVSSLGSLTLDAFTLSAPSITLNAASIFIKSTASLTGDLISLSANSIVFDGLSSPGSSIQILPGRDIIPPPISPPLDTTITLLPGGDIGISGGAITSVPLPASFTMLLTGLLTLVSVSRRSNFRNVR